jgi:RecA-family ATPase
MTPSALRLKLVRMGYLPIPLYGKEPPTAANNKWKKGFGGWSEKLKAPPSSWGIRMWEKTWPDAVNTGGLTWRTPAIDIDILHPEAADAAEQFTRDRFEQRGKILVRTGLAPKRAILLRTDNPFTKLARKFIAPDGSKHKIEILGDGQQLVYDGVHPDTQQPYTWRGGDPSTVLASELPEVSGDEAEEYLDAVSAQLIEVFDFKLDDGREAAWAKSALKNVAAELSDTAEGDRNNKLYKCAFRMGTMIARKWIARDVVEAELEKASAACGLDKDGHRGVLATIKSGIEDGLECPHEDLPDGTEVTAQFETYFAEELELDPVELVDWVVKNFIPTNAVTGLFGDGGTGKDLLLFMLAACVISGKHWLGKEVKQGRVMYFPVEDDRKELRRRQAAIAEHYDIRYADFPRQLKIVPLAGKDTVLAVFNHKSGVVKPTAQYFQIKKMVEEFRPSVVIVGNRVNIFSVNQNDDAQARQCLQLLSAIAIEYETAVIMPGHVSVAGLATGSGTSGSVQWSNGCRSRLFLSRIVDKEAGEELDSDARLLEVRKANWGPTKNHISLRWQLGVFVEDAGVVWMPGQAQTLLDEEMEFLRMLDLTTMRVSMRQRANNYAPKIFSEDPRCKHRRRAGKKRLQEAMERLVLKGSLVTVEYGPPSHRAEKLVRAGAEGGSE